MHRKDIPAAWQVDPLPGGGADHPLDVILVPKHRLWSHSIAQRPCVALSFQCISSLTTRLPTSLRLPTNPTYRLAKNWLDLAKELLRLYPHDERIARTARYLVSLAQGQRCRGPLQDLPHFRSSRTDQEHTPSCIHRVGSLTVTVHNHCENMFSISCRSCWTSSPHGMSRSHCAGWWALRLSLQGELEHVRLECGRAQKPQGLRAKNGTAQAALATAGRNEIAETRIVVEPVVVVVTIQMRAIIR